MLGFTAKAQINDGASSTFVDITSPVMIGLPDMDVGEVERTPLDKTTNRYKEFRPTLIDAGTLKVEIYWSATEFSRIKGLIENGRLNQFKVIGPTVDDNGVAFTTPESFTFDGFFKKLSPGTYEREGIRVFSVEFKVSNAPTYTAST